MDCVKLGLVDKYELEGFYGFYAVNVWTLGNLLHMGSTIGDHPKTTIATLWWLPTLLLAAILSNAEVV
jgi:hypothetical protein